MRSLAGLASAVPRAATLRRSQYWPRERLDALARDRLAAMLAAARKIPFYASRLPPPRDPGEHVDLESLPVLHRADVAELARSVRSRHGDGARFLADRSSGSTGMPAEFLFDASHQRGRFAARLRYLWENGWNPLARGAWITHLPVGTPDAALIRWRVAPGARFIDHGTPFDEQLRRLRAFEPTYLYTLPSNLDGLLDAIERAGARFPLLRRLFSGGEVLDDSLRERARSVLGLEIADNYGSTEAFPAWQCPARSFHVNAEHVMLEIVDDRGRAVPPGVLGRVILTTLENHLMPLVRYEIGDYAIALDGSCPCGRTLPLVGRIAGRGINLFRLHDGSRLTPWHLVRFLKARPFFRRFQIVQRSLERYLIRYVADADVDPPTRAALQEEFASVVGPDSRVEFERRVELPRAPSGKFMTALSEVE
jgi:phenylacetate-CoA ligase